MKFRTKAVIFAAAVMISLIGFGLIAAPAVDVIVISKKAGHEIITNYLAKTDLPAKLNSSKG